MWVPDPVTKIKSVSLTLGCLCTTAIIVAGALEIAGVVKTTGPFLEMFYSGWALYFGRRFNVGGKVFASDKAEELKAKLE